jgi:hypothetical protein
VIIGGGTLDPDHRSAVRDAGEHGAVDAAGEGRAPPRSRPAERLDDDRSFATR